MVFVKHQQQTISGTTYEYHYLYHSYRDENGEPTNFMIGKLGEGVDALCENFRDQAKDIDSVSKKDCDRFENRLRDAFDNGDTDDEIAEMLDDEDILEEPEDEDEEGYESIGDWELELDSESRTIWSPQDKDNLFVTFMENGDLTVDFGDFNMKQTGYPKRDSVVVADEGKDLDYAIEFLDRNSPADVVGEFSKYLDEPDPALAITGRSDNEIHVFENIYFDPDDEEYKAHNHEMNDVGGDSGYVEVEDMVVKLEFTSDGWKVEVVEEDPLLNYTIDSGDIEIGKGDQEGTLVFHEDDADHILVYGAVMDFDVSSETIYNMSDEELREVEEEIMDYLDTAPLGATFSNIQSSVGENSRVVSKALNNLIDQGLVEENDRGRYVRKDIEEKDSITEAVESDDDTDLVEGGTEDQRKVAKMIVEIAEAEYDEEELPDYSLPLEVNTLEEDQEERSVNKHASVNMRGDIVAGNLKGSIVSVSVSDSYFDLTQTERRYVRYHEAVHFRVPDHSREFYEELQNVIEGREGDVVGVMREMFIIDLLSHKFDPASFLDDYDGLTRSDVDTLMDNHYELVETVLLETDSDKFDEVVPGKTINRYFNANMSSDAVAEFSYGRGRGKSKEIIVEIDLETGKLEDKSDLWVTVEEYDGSSVKYDSIGDTTVEKANQKLTDGIAKLKDQKSKSIDPANLGEIRSIVQKGGVKQLDDATLEGAYRELLEERLVYTDPEEHALLIHPEWAGEEVDEEMFNWMKERQDEAYTHLHVMKGELDRRGIDVPNFRSKVGEIPEEMPEGSDSSEKSDEEIVERFDEVFGIDEDAGIPDIVEKDSYDVYSDEDMVVMLVVGTGRSDIVENLTLYGYGDELFGDLEEIGESNKGNTVVATEELNDSRMDDKVSGYNKEFIEKAKEVLGGFNYYAREDQPISVFNDREDAVIVIAPMFVDKDDFEWFEDPEEDEEEEEDEEGMNEEAVKQLTKKGAMVGREGAKILTEEDVETILSLDVTPMYVSREMVEQIRELDVEATEDLEDIEIDSGYSKFRLINEISEFVGVDGEVYDLEVGESEVIPRDNAVILENRGTGEILEDHVSDEFSSVKKNVKFVMVNEQSLTFDQLVENMDVDRGDVSEVVENWAGDKVTVINKENDTIVAWIGEDASHTKDEWREIYSEDSGEDEVTEELKQNIINLASGKVERDLDEVVEIIQSEKDVSRQTIVEAVSIVDIEGHIEYDGVTIADPDATEEDQIKARHIDLDAEIPEEAVAQAIDQLENPEKGDASYIKVVEAVTGYRGFMEGTVENAIENLKDQGDAFEPRQGRLKLIDYSMVTEGSLTQDKVEDRIDLRKWERYEKDSADVFSFNHKKSGKDLWIQDEKGKPTIYGSVVSESDVTDHPMPKFRDVDEALRLFEKVSKDWDKNFEDYMDMEDDEPEVSEVAKIQDEVLEVIEEHETDEGVNYDVIRSELPYEDDLLESAVNRLLSEGTCYEPKPGHIKKL